MNSARQTSQRSASKTPREVSFPGYASPQWLEDNLDAEWLRIIDLRDRAAFQEGHIPGSVLLDLDRLFDARGPKGGTLVWAPELALVMSELGVGDEHMVIVVDNDIPRSAEHAASALRRSGHYETLILTGGFTRWANEGRSVTREIARHPFASFTAKTHAAR